MIEPSRNSSMSQSVTVVEADRTASIIEIDALSLTGMTEASCLHRLRPDQLQVLTAQQYTCRERLAGNQSSSSPLDCFRRKKTNAVVELIAMSSAL